MSKFILDAQAGQLHGEMKNTVVTVSGGPTLVPPTPLKGRKDFILYNGSSDVIFVGGPTVSDTDGIPVPSMGSFAIQAGRVQVHAVVSGTNQTIRVLEVS